jgi:hypothetical protein
LTVWTGWAEVPFCGGTPSKFGNLNPLLNRTNTLLRLDK